MRDNLADFWCIVRYQLPRRRSKTLALVRRLARSAPQCEERDGWLTIWLVPPDGLTLLTEIRRATLDWAGQPDWSLDGLTFSSDPPSFSCVVLGESATNPNLIWPSGDPDKHDRPDPVGLDVVSTGQMLGVSLTPDLQELARQAAFPPVPLCLHPRCVVHKQSPPTES